MEAPTPVTNIDTLPTALLEWLGEKKIKPGEGDVWLTASTHWAAMQGDLDVLEFLLAQGASPDAHTDDPELKIVGYPLHWAAINGRLMFCKVLLDNGAQVDTRGGDLDATPMMWAAKNGQVYIVHLLLQYGADPFLLDSQGFNTLHLATHSSNIMLILYLLHQPLIVPDLPDPQEHTAMMWAAYQGDALSVDVFLRFGADVKKRDKDGLTALHWAVVRGNKMCMRRLIEEGSDINAVTKEDKSPMKLAEEMKCSLVLSRALQDSGRFNEDGTPRIQPRFSNDQCKKLVFCAPFFIIWISIIFLSTLPIYLSCLLTPGWLYVSNYAVQNYLIKELHGTNGQVHKTPYLSGIFTGTAVLVALRWIFAVLRCIPAFDMTNIATFFAHPFMNVVFGLTFATSMYCFTQATMSDPGYIPRPAGISEQKKIVEDLVIRGEFDPRHFCTSCFVRKSLRSKHCRICERCVARHDQYRLLSCRANVVIVHGFVTYVTLLELGIPMFIYLVYLRIPLPSDAQCSILPMDICQPLITDPYTTILAIWAAAQLIWLSILVLAQHYQIAKGITTHEFSNLQKFGFLGGGGITVEDRLQEGISSRLPPIGTSDLPHPGRFHKCLRVLGVEQFFNTFRDKRKQAVAQRRGMNPFDQGGCLTNCGDFWSVPEHVDQESPQRAWLDSGLRIRGKGFKLSKGGVGRLGGEEVNYFEMWEVPDRRRKTRRVDQQYEALGQLEEGI